MKKENIFVSYRRTDLNGNTSGTDIARTIKQHLEISGYKDQVFFDYSEISDDEFERTILREIERSKVMILVLTNDTMYRCVSDHDWVRREILHAIKHNIKIIPVEVDNLFNGYPDDLCKELDIIKRLHHSKVHMDSSFESDMDIIITKRIRPILKPAKAFNFKVAFIALFTLIVVALGIAWFTIGNNRGDRSTQDDNTSATTEASEIASDVATDVATEQIHEVDFKVNVHTPTNDELKEIDKLLQDTSASCPTDIGDGIIWVEVYRVEDTIIYEYTSYQVDLIELSTSEDIDISTIKSRVSNEMKAFKGYFIYQWVEFYKSAKTDGEYADAPLIIESGMDIRYNFRDVNGIHICTITVTNSEIVREIERVIMALMQA